MLPETLILVLGVGYLSCISATPVLASTEDQFQKIQQKMDQMQKEINELKSTNAIPGSGM